MISRYIVDKRGLCFQYFPSLVIIILVFGVLGCSDNESSITTPNIVDDPWEISLNRVDWFWASAPFLSPEEIIANNDTRQFDPADRVEAVRWYLPKDRVLRRYLNPDLLGQERDATQPSMEMYLRADDESWDSEDWGGIMRGLGRTGLDLSKSQFVEIWINDGVPDILQRRGKLHMDFGYISEDGFWPADGDGDLIVGNRQQEDGIVDGVPDGVFSVQEEDIGLDGLEFGPQRFDAGYEINGDSPFPSINGTARNFREDDEDLNGDGLFSSRNGFFTATIDLGETEAMIDVVYDYEDVQDLVDQHLAWRKYRLPMSSLDSVSVDGVVANLSTVGHVRVWYEDNTPQASLVKRVQISGFEFVDDQMQ